MPTNANSTAIWNIDSTQPIHYYSIALTMYHNTMQGNYTLMRYHKSTEFVTPDQMLRIHRPRNPIRRFTTNIVYIILNSYTSLWHPIRFRFAPYTNSVHLHFTEYQKYAIISVYTPVVSVYKYHHRMPTIQFWHRIDAPSRVLRTCLTTNTKTKARAPLVSIRLSDRICFV